ncbi:hypothetical protein VKT23_014846 [Stygiomarasmius scandens]|uniref:Uncharacterized protein n=1 Tax=Marasmiellus scandens TaxID=2682957 RepID=A0ABR1IZM2_9AGAR
MPHFVHIPSEKVWVLKKYVKREIIERKEKFLSAKTVVDIVTEAINFSSMNRVSSADIKKWIHNKPEYTAHIGSD